MNNEQLLNLKELRDSFGYTQQQMADYLGVSQHNYGYWERQGHTRAWDLYIRAKLKWPEKISEPINLSPMNLAQILSIIPWDRTYTTHLLGVHYTTMSAWLASGTPDNKPYGNLLMLMAEHPEDSLWQIYLAPDEEEKSA